MTSDELRLLREYAVSGAEAAFETLVARHVNLVHSAAARRVGDGHVAEEITQVVFIILSRKAASLGPKTVLSGWLYRTTLYVASDALKRERRRQQREQEAYMQSSLEDSSAEKAWQELSPLLDEGMARLGQADRDALVLRYFEGRSLDEVGSALGLNGEAAKKRVQRGVEKLRAFFARRGVASTTDVIAGVISAHSVQAAPAVLAKTIAAVAVVKGATAGSSTLALVKGALQLMAWTKAKTTILVSACVLLTAGTATVTLYNNSAKPARGMPKDWSVLRGTSEQWYWADNRINAQSTNGDCILASTMKYRDLTLSATASTATRDADFAIRMQDADNGYLVLFVPDGTPWGVENGSHVSLLKRTAGEEVTLASFKRRGLPQSAKITVIAKGPWIEVRLNEVEVLRTNDTTFASGFIGLRICGDSTKPCEATFSNLAFH